MNNILYINAGAGSGKTYRLTHDLADFLTGGNGKDEKGHNPNHVIIKPSEVIVTTFTKAAANEIKERAREVLLEKNRIEDATQLETSSIGTIHSVARQFLNKYWYLIGSCPNQDVLSDEDKDIYRNQSLASFIDGNGYIKEREAIRLYFDEFQPTKWENNRNVPDPDFWIGHVDLIVRKATYYGITDFGKSIDESCAEIDRLFPPKGSNAVSMPTQIDFANIIQELIECYKKAIEEKKKDAEKKKKEAKCKGEDETIKELEKFSSPLTYSSLLSLFNKVKDRKYDNKGKVKKDYSIYQPEIDKLEKWLRSYRFGEILKGSVNAVFTIAKAWMDDYDAFKREHGVIDHDDMEKGFLKLLNIQEVRDEIENNYKLVMVDEFQDCNPMQLRIFSKISDIIAPKSTLPYSSIWVGDPNQAIYGFRGSDTELINRVKEKFTVKHPDKTVDAIKKYDGLSKDTLDTSYRSREQLVKYANSIFGNGLFPDFMELDSDRGENEELGAPVKLWNFQKADKSDKTNMTVFAQHLKKLVEGGPDEKEQITKGDQLVNIKGKKILRHIEYKDIAILANTHSDIDKLVEVLRQEGVPASAPESNIWDRAEIQLVLAILNLRANEKEERPHELASLLKLWGDRITEDVIKERINNMGKEWNSSSYDELKPVRIALDHTKGLSIDKKITALILELDIYNKVEKWGDGDVRRQNLMTLQNVAQQFVARCTRLSIAPTEKNFYLYLKSAQINPDKDNTSNSVKVYTYHGSKGLEWPVVILYSLDYDPYEKFVIREYYGVHEIPCGDNDKIIRDYYIFYMPPLADSEIKPLIGEIEKSVDYYITPRERIKNERKRLFYVGLTRARDYAVYYAAPTITKNNPTGDCVWDKDFKWLNTIGIEEKVLKANEQVFEPIAPLEEDKRKNAARPYAIHDFDPLPGNTYSAKYIHPSTETGTDDKEKDEQNYVFSLIPGAKRISIPKADAMGKPIYYRADRFGSCIHNIYAACPYDGVNDLTQEQMDNYVKAAEGIIRNYRLSHVITDAKALINNLLSLFKWLEGKYGKPTSIVHEYPFNYPYGENDEQVIRGEMDLVYCTETTDVIIDFKNYVGDDTSLTDSAGEGKYNIHFVNSHYRPQLTKYREIWNKANPSKDIGLFLYYNILGGVVEIK